MDVAPRRALADVNQASQASMGTMVKVCRDNGFGGSLNVYMNCNCMYMHCRCREHVLPGRKPTKGEGISCASFSHPPPSPCSSYNPQSTLLIGTNSFIFGRLGGRPPAVHEVPSRWRHSARRSLSARATCLRHSRQLPVPPGLDIVP